MLITVKTHTYMHSYTHIQWVVALCPCFGQIFNSFPIDWSGLLAVVRATAREVQRGQAVKQIPACGLTSPRLNMYKYCKLFPTNNSSSPFYLPEQLADRGDAVVPPRPLSLGREIDQGCISEWTAENVCCWSADLFWKSGQSEVVSETFCLFYFPLCSFWAA